MPVKNKILQVVSSLLSMYIPFLLEQHTDIVIKEKQQEV